MRYNKHITINTKKKHTRLDQHSFHKEVIGNLILGILVPTMPVHQ